MQICNRVIQEYGPLKGTISSDPWLECPGFLSFVTSEVALLVSKQLCKLRNL